MKKSVIEKFKREFIISLETSCPVLRKEKNGNWIIETDCQWDDMESIYIAVDGYLPIKQAFYDGHEVLYRKDNSNKWERLICPIFEKNCTYLVKPKTLFSVGNIVTLKNNNEGPKLLFAVTSGVLKKFQNGTLDENDFELYCTHSKNKQYAFKKIGIGKPYFVSTIKRIVEKDNRVYFIDIDGNQWDLAVPLDGDISPYDICPPTEDVEYHN